MEKSSSTLLYLRRMQPEPLTRRGGSSWSIPSQQASSNPAVAPPPSVGSSCSSCSLEPLLTSIQYRTGVTYEGYVAKNHTWSGMGSFQWTSGLLYIGEFKKRKREGFGRLIWPDGSSYEGYFHNDLREGHGKHTWGDSGETYEGKYHNDKRHGRGVYRWLSGASFTGTFKEDLKTGPGVYTSPHGERYEGLYSDDVRCGEGVVTYPGGRQDVGKWRGMKLVRLKYAVREVTVDPLESRLLSKSHGLYTPDIKSRGLHGPKGYLEVASQEFIQEAGNGNLSKVRALLESGAVYVDVVDKRGHSALFAAAVVGHHDVVNYLLDNGADVNQADDMGMSVLNACHHVLHSSHPKMKVVLDQLQMALPSSVPPQSSFLSSSDEGDTEVISTSDFTSSVRFCEEEGLGVVGKKYRRGAPGRTATTEQILARTQSLVAIGDFSGFNDIAKSNRLYRTKSYPQFQPQVDKHVTFRPSLTSEYSGISGVESKPSRGVCWSSSRALPVKSKEIYVNLSYFGSSKHSWRSGLAMTVEDNEGGSTSEGTGKATESSMAVAEGRVDPARSEEGVDLTASANGDILGVSAVNSDSSSPNPHPAEDNSLTASANGEIMGMSAVNSEFSSEPHVEGTEDLSMNSSSPKVKPSSRSRAKSDITLSLRSPGGRLKSGQPSSLPTLSITPVTGRHTPPHGTKLSPLLHQTRGGSMGGGVKLSPLRHAKKRVTIPSLGAPGELHDSSIFSSTRYGPILSAAESTTLSCVGSEQNMTGSISSASIDQAPVLTLCAAKLEDVIKLLLSRGAGPNVSPIPLQPMFYAVLAGQIELVRNLLKSGAKPDECLPDELGGYSLLHLATGNVTASSPAIVDLLLQYGADPNSGGRREGHEQDGDSEVEGGKVEGGEEHRKRKLIGGENEGGVVVTPLHTLCSVGLPKSAEEREEICEVMPILVRKLIEYGADVNMIANGHSPLSLTVLNGHDSSVDVLLESGADPNVPLGKGAGNAVCTLTTNKAHRSRSSVAVTATLSLLHKLILAGADIFAKVMLAKGKVGTVMDFAHVAFQSDRRMSTLKYDNLTKMERSCYRSSKKLKFHLRNLFRCKALQTLATEGNLLQQLEMKIQGPPKATNEISFNFLRFLSDDSHSSSYRRQSTGNSSFCERATVSAGATVRTGQSRSKKSEVHIVWLPEVTLTVSLNLLNRAIHHGNYEEKEVEERVSASLMSRSGKVPRLVRYRELLEKANSILAFYSKAKMDRRMDWWNFQTFCYECGRSGGVVVLDECPRCHIVSYCGRQCRLESWKKGHKDECNQSSKASAGVPSKSSQKNVVKRKRPNTGRL